MNESELRENQRDEMLRQARLSAGMAGVAPPDEPAPIVDEDYLWLAKREQEIEDWYQSGDSWPEDDSAEARTLHPILWRSRPGKPWSDKKP